MKRNLKQYDSLMPGLSAKIRMFTSSPLAFKSAIKVAILQMKMLKGSTTTAGISSNFFKNGSSNYTEKLVEQLKFSDGLPGHSDGCIGSNNTKDKNGSR